MERPSQRTRGASTIRQKTDRHVNGLIESRKGRRAQPWAKLLCTKAVSDAAWRRSSSGRLGISDAWRKLSRTASPGVGGSTTSELLHSEEAQSTFSQSAGDVNHVTSVSRAKANLQKERFFGYGAARRRSLAIEQLFVRAC
jgi:hypothetical protein